MLLGILVVGILLLGILEIMIFDRFLVHDVGNVLFPFVFGFPEFIDPFAQGTEEFGYFLRSKEQEDDQKDKYDFSAAKVSDEGKSMCWSGHISKSIVGMSVLGNFFVQTVEQKKKRLPIAPVVSRLPVWAC